MGAVIMIWQNLIIQPLLHRREQPGHPYPKRPEKDLKGSRDNLKHWAISYGHVGADLISLAAMLRIPVAMHNVAEESIFRPSTWGLFGGKAVLNDRRATI